MNSQRILPAAVLLCTLAAACGETPTGPGAQAQPGGASYDGGYTMGSGNRSESGGGYTIGSGNETQDAGGGFTIGSESPEDGSTPPAGETERGGYTMGSGN